MKKELYKRGPIACTIDVTLKFEHYQGTVFENYSKSLFFIKSKTMNCSPFLKLTSLAQCFKTTFMRLLGWFSNTLSKVAFIRKSFITLFIWIMKSASSAGVLTTKPEQNIGLAEIHGALIGASLDFSALKCTRTTSASRRHVCGLCQGQARLFSPGFFFLHPNK